MADLQKSTRVPVQAEFPPKLFNLLAAAEGRTTEEGASALGASVRSLCGDVAGCPKLSLPARSSCPSSASIIRARPAAVLRLVLFEALTYFSRMHLITYFLYMARGNSFLAST